MRKIGTIILVVVVVVIIISLFQALRCYTMK